MKPPPKQTVNAPMAPHEERRAMMAVLAVFALLVQALVATPAMAMTMAAPLKAHGAFGEVAICTSHGLQTVSADDAGGPPPPADDAGSCGHCVCPTAAALTSPLPAGFAPRLAYAAEQRRGPSTDRLPPTRGPPRPYGQGPPPPNA